MGGLRVMLYCVHACVSHRPQKSCAGVHRCTKTSYFPTAISVYFLYDSISLTVTVLIVKQGDRKTLRLGDFAFASE